MVSRNAELLHVAGGVVREEAGEAGPDHKGPVCCSKPLVLRERTQGEVHGCWVRGVSFVLDMPTARLSGTSKWHLMCDLRLSREARDISAGREIRT